MAPCTFWQACAGWPPVSWARPSSRRRHAGPVAVVVGGVLDTGLSILRQPPRLPPSRWSRFTRLVAPEAAGSGVQEIEGAMEGAGAPRRRRVAGEVRGRRAGPVVRPRGGPRGSDHPHGGVDRAGRLGAHEALGSGVARPARRRCGGRPRGGLQRRWPRSLQIEETRKQFRYTLRSYTAVIIASTASAVGMELVGGTAPQLKLDNAEMPLSMLPAFLVLGVFLGGLGIVFNRTLLFLLDWVAATFRKVPFVPASARGRCCDRRSGARAASGRRRRRVADPRPRQRQPADSDPAAALPVAVRRSW